METNPYITPQSDVRAPQRSIPDAVQKKIRNGWVAAIVSGVLTLLAVVAAVTMGADGMFNAWNLLDVVLIFFLAFWIHKRSRVAATTMFCYFLVSKIIVIVETGQASGGLIALIFLYFYFQAMVGTFQYHKLRGAA